MQKYVRKFPELFKIPFTDILFNGAGSSSNFIPPKVPSTVYSREIKKFQSSVSVKFSKEKTLPPRIPLERNNEDDEVEYKGNDDDRDIIDILTKPRSKDNDNLFSMIGNLEYVFYN